MRYLIFLLLTGCSSHYLSVYTDFVGIETLASFHVGTPDPELRAPSYGQRLHIAWRLPVSSNLTIRARIRFANLKEVEWVFPVSECRGRVSYVLLNEDYDTTGGILSYKVDLLDGDHVIEEERHALWTELILF